MRVSNMIQAIDLHACGEHGRVIVGGVLDVPGKSTFEKMTYLRTHADGLRKRMLREPRGYPAANCNLILPATRPEAQAGYVIMEQVEYPGMSGTNTICVVTALLETGMLPMVEPVTELTPNEGREIVRIGEMIKAAACEQLPVVHPEQPGFAGISISQLSGPPSRPDAHRKNAVIVSTGKLDWDNPSTWTGAIDRSPCGTGTCAKMATLWAKGQLPLNQDFRHEGILGTVFTGRLLEETQVGPYRAVVPTLSGTAWITGITQYVLDPEDPFPEGFTVGDIW